MGLLPGVGDGLLRKFEAVPERLDAMADSIADLLEGVRATNRLLERIAVALEGGNK